MVFKLNVLTLNVLTFHITKDKIFTEFDCKILVNMPQYAYAYCIEIYTQRHKTKLTA